MVILPVNNETLIYSLVIARVLQDMLVKFVLPEKLTLEKLIKVLLSPSHDLISDLT